MGFRGVVVGLAVLVSLMLAGRADASLSIDPNPVFFDTGLISGRIDLVAVDTGTPPGGTVLEGSIGGTDDTFVFQITMFTGTIRRFGVGAMDDVGSGISSTSAGTIFGDDVDVSMFSSISGPNQRVFQFDGNVGLLAPDSSDEFFVSFASGAVEEGDAINFMITPGIGMGSTFTIDVSVVPAPGALAVLACVGVGARRARRRRST